MERQECLSPPEAAPARLRCTVLLGATIEQAKEVVWMGVVEYVENHGELPPGIPEEELALAKNQSSDSKPEPTFTNKLFPPDEDSELFYLLEYAIREPDPEIVKLFSEHGVREPHREIVKMLIEKGVSVHAKLDRIGNTPLIIAAACSPMEVVQYLISLGGDVNARNEYGNTPLSHAVARRESNTDNTEVVKYLVAQGAEVNTSDEFGCTPLHKAAMYDSHIDILEYLVSEGADVHAQDNGGRTPLDVADAEEKKRILRAATADLHCRTS